jgi:hypothetical protein
VNPCDWIVSLTRWLLRRACSPIAVPDGDRRGQVPKRDEIVAQLLEGGIRVGGLVRRGVVDQRRLLLAGLLLDHRPEALALGPPLSPVFLEERLGFDLVEAQVPRHPAVFGLQVIERVQHSGEGRSRKSRDRQGAEEMVPEHGHIAGRKRHVRQERIQVHRRLGRAHGMAMGRNRAVQVCERLVVIERAHVGEHPRQDVDDLGDRLLKVPEFSEQRRALVGRAAAGLVEEEGRGARAPFGRQPPRERQVVARFVMSPRVLERSLSFPIDHRGRRVRPV